MDKYSEISTEELGKRIDYLSLSIERLRSVINKKATELEKTLLEAIEIRDIIESRTK